MKSSKLLKKLLSKLLSNPMFIIRNSYEQDIEDIYKLSCLETLINLPSKKEALMKIIKNSLESFKSPHPQRAKNHYLFVIEDTDTSRVIGTAMIHGQHGTEEEPHFFFRVYNEKKFSKTINTGFIHGILELDYEPNGFSEIGGLILHPDYRGSRERVGKQLAFSRFLYMTLYPNRFTNVIHSELLPPLNKEGLLPLWEAIGKKFTNMNYDEAHRLSLINKEFIINLFPWNEKIYKSLLPVEARNAIGQVNEKTKPVKAMLEKIGFQYTNEVDPFDGGPHYRCQRTEILPIKQAQKVNIQLTDQMSSSLPYLINIEKDQYSFFCIKVDGQIKNGKLLISKEWGAKLNIKEHTETISVPLSI